MSRKELDKRLKDVMKELEEVRGEMEKQDPRPQSDISRLHRIIELLKRCFS